MKKEWTKCIVKNENKKKKIQNLFILIESKMKEKLYTFYFNRNGTKMNPFFHSLIIVTYV